MEQAAMQNSLETSPDLRHEAHTEGPDPAAVGRAVRAALDEDCAVNDVTTRWAVDADARGRAEFVAKAEGVVAGLEVVRATFEIGDPSVRMSIHLPDKTRVMPGDVIANVSGS